VRLIQADVDGGRIGGDASGCKLEIRAAHSGEMTGPEQNGGGTRENESRG